MLSRSSKKSKLYIAAMSIGVAALLGALLNGFYRGHWFKFGIFTDVIVLLSMGCLLLQEKRRFNRRPLSL